MRPIKRHQRLLPLLALAACYSTAPHAGEHGHRHHEAHEHGVGLLNVAVEQNSLHIELESPAMNIVGFEHQPRDEKQHETVEQAVARLKEGEKLFVTPTAAGCTLQQAEVESGLLEGHDEHEHQEAGRKEEAHADFVASYRFECRKPEALDSITVKLFATFPATEELQVQLLTGQGQSAMELNAANPQIGL